MYFIIARHARVTNYITSIKKITQWVVWHRSKCLVPNTWYAHFLKCRLPREWDWS